MQRLLIGFLCFFFFLTACNSDQEEAGGKKELDRNENSMYQDDLTKTRYGYDTRDPNREKEDRFLGQGQNEIGYFRYDPSYYKNSQSGTADPGIRIDRPTLAKYIAGLVADLPNVKESTVLVTDDHVFVGIVPKKKNQKTVQEAKRTAESVTPRYFRIHVTDSKSLQSSINELGLRMQKNGDVDGVRNSLNQLLKKMGDETPPG